MQSIGISVRTLAGALALLLLLAGCPPLPPPPGDNRLGTLQAIGPNVYRNQRQAASGEPVFDGDKLSTGGGSSAVVHLADGGLIQLDENTDPLIERRVVDGRSCIHLSIRFGRVWIDRDLVCVDTPDTSLVLQSRVNLEAAGRSTTVTVYGGRVDVLRPAALALGAGQQVSVAGGRMAPVRMLNAEQLFDAVAWTEKFGTPRYPQSMPEAWCCDPRGEVFLASPADCRKRGGRFFPDQGEAQRQCWPAAPLGFCCIKGTILIMERRHCAERAGSYYDDEAQARRQCRSPEPVGFCCIKGDILRMDRRNCVERAGSYSDDEAQARRQCRPPEKATDWCCSAQGRIFQTTRAQCVREGGHAYATRQQAGSDRRCRLD